MSQPSHDPRGGSIPPESGLSPGEGGGDTKDRLLDAAERLFGERGFEGTSLRAVTQAAGTSVSAAHYHFGSKEALLRATLLRRVEPINRRRLAALDALEASTPTPSVEALLEAYLRPVFEERAASSAGDGDPTRNPARLVAARLYSDPPELVASLKRELFAEVSGRLLGALARALPDHPRSELALGLQLLVGMMVHVLSGNLEDAPHLEGGARVLDDEALLERLVAVAAAGLRALPVASAHATPADGSAARSARSARAPAAAAGKEGR